MFVLLDQELPTTSSIGEGLTELSTTFSLSASSTSIFSVLSIELFRSSNPSFLSDSETVKSKVLSGLPISTYREATSAMILGFASISTVLRAFSETPFT